MRLFIILCFIYCASGQYEESESTSDYEDGYSDVDYNENHRDGPGGGIDLTDILDNGNEAKKFLDALENNSTNDVDDIEGDPFSLIPKMNFTQNTSVPEWWEPMFWSRSTPCDEWGPLNHYFFHIANIFLLFSYLAPNSIYGLLYLRFMVATGCVFFSLWGYFILCAFDTFFWNVILSGINLICIASMLWYLKPVCLPPELNEVYETLFKPLKVSKQQFKKTVGCIKEFREIQDHRHHAEEKVTNIETLSLLLRGRMIVSQKGRALHLIARNQFLDSPEWFGSSSDECFQVTITALEDCRVLVWQRDKLRLTLMSDPFLNAVFDHVLGRDVVKKLTQVQDAIVAMTGDWMLTEKTDLDEKQALIAKQIDDGPQIVAMLNRSYNGKKTPRAQMAILGAMTIITLKDGAETPLNLMVKLSS